MKWKKILSGVLACALAFGSVVSVAPAPAAATEIPAETDGVLSNTERGGVKSGTKITDAAKTPLAMRQSETVDVEELSEIVNPGDVVQAYAGQQTVFYVKAGGAVSYAAEGLENFNADENAASFDTATGEFKWTPVRSQVAHTYRLTFTANGADGQSVSKAVQVQVGDPMQKCDVKKRVEASEDAHLQTWTGEQGLNYGSDKMLRVNRAGSTILSEGERLDGEDTKLGLLKFRAEDFSEIDKERIFKADLVLTYVGRRNDTPVKNRLNVVQNNSFSWTETEVNWDSWNAWRQENSYAVTEDEVCTSAEYNTQGTANGDGIANNAQLDPERKIYVPITEMIREMGAAAEGDSLNLLFNVKDDGEEYFVSKEGANGGFDEGVPEMAPAIEILSSTGMREFAIEGPSSLTLVEGYAAGEASDSFSILGGEGASVSLSGDTADGAIRWDAASRQIKVEAGLKRGVYEVELIASEEGKAAKKAFTLTVKAPLAFTNPSQVQAYAGQQLIFYVNAISGNEYSALTEDLLSMNEGKNPASFNQETGEFKWTPAKSQVGLSYQVTFTADDGEYQKKRKTVTIQVDDAGYEKRSERMEVSADAFVGSWGYWDEPATGDAVARYGGRIGLAVNKYQGGNSPGAATGLLGEVSGGHDSKMSFLKFDLSDCQAGSFDTARLVLTYVGCRAQDGYAKVGDMDTLHVAAVPSDAQNADWKETDSSEDSQDGITWNTRPVFEVSPKEAAVESAPYQMTNALDSYTTTNRDKKIDGKKINVDVTEFVKDGVGRELTLAVNEAKGYEHYFVSREGVTENGYIEATADMAPAIELLSNGTQRDLAIDGPTGLTLVEGYTGATTDSFSILGSSDLTDVTMELSGDTGAGKISWDESSRQIKIAKGLGKGVYNVELKAELGGKTATRTFSLTVREENLPPVFTKPAKNVLKAYEGRELVFYVKAEDPNVGDKVTYEADLSSFAELKAANLPVFEKAAGKFTWTPPASSMGRSYDVEFIAADSNGEKVKKRVSIAVDTATVDVNTAEPLFVAADANVGSYSSDQANNSGGNRSVAMNKSADSQGILGEVSGGNDSKIAFMKFDLSDLSANAFDNARLVLTYIGYRKDSGAAPAGTTDRIKVYPLEEGAEWTEKGEGGITWSTKPAFTATEDAVLESLPHLLVNRVSNQTVNNDNTEITGTKVSVDITDWVKARAGRTLSMAMNESKEYENYFVSREGAADSNYQNATLDMAPAIVLYQSRSSFTIDGPKEMTLREGYAATETDSFDITGPAGFDITVSCAADTDKKITWSGTQLKIASGLTRGEYPVTITAKADGVPDATYTFTVTVEYDYMKDLQKALNDYKVEDADRAQYTSASWSAYQAARTDAENVLSDEEAKKAIVEQAIANLKAAYEGLLTYEEAIGDALRKYGNAVESECMPATWTEYKAALDAVKALQGVTPDSPAAAAEIDEKIASLKDAYEALRYKCTCAIAEISALDSSIVIGEDDETGYVTLLPSVTLSAESCKAHEKPDKSKVAYSFNVKDAGTTGAAVDEETGLMTAAKDGTATVTVTATLAREGSESVTLSKDVSVKVRKAKCTCKVTSVTVTDLELKIAASAQNGTVHIKPDVVLDAEGCELHEEAHKENVSYAYAVESAGTTGATVDATTGIVTASAAGTAKVRVTATLARKNNAEPATQEGTVTVTVVKSDKDCECSMTEILLDDVQITIPRGEESGTAQLSPDVTLSASDCEMHDTVDKEKVSYVYALVDAGTIGATLSESGLVTANASGEATIQVTATFTRDGSTPISLNKTIVVSVVKNIANKDALKKSIDSAKALNEKEGNYTADSWSALQAALTAAENVMKDSAADQDAMNKAKSDLDQTVKDLKTKAQADKEALTAPVIGTGDTITLVTQGALGSVITWESNHDAIRIDGQTATVVRGDAEVEVTLTATIVYGTGEGNLTQTATFTVKVPKKGETPTTPDEPDKVDKTALNEAIAAAEKLNAEEYTADTWAELQTALQAAKSAAEDANATKAEVDEKKAALDEAVENLKTKAKDTAEKNVAADSEALTAPVIGTGDLLSLPTEGANGSKITWSSDSDAVKIDGGVATVVRGDAEVEVTLTATVTFGEGENAVSVVKEFKVMVPKADPVIEAAMADVKKELDAMKAIIDAGNANGLYSAEAWAAFSNAYNTLKAKFEAGNLSVDEMKSLTQELLKAQETLKASAEKKVTGIRFAQKKYQIAKGKKIDLKKEVTIVPEDATNKSLTYTLDKKSAKYATLKNGIVTTKKSGAGKTVKVTVTSADGSVKQTVSIQIMKNAVTKVTVKGKKKVTVKAGKSCTIKTAVKANGSKANKKLKWTSSNEKFATVNAKGKVRTKKAGAGKTVKITAVSTDGTNKKVQVTIKIKK